MSTASLQAHKKVASVTLNDAGKAATLTLKAPWLFEGSRGPFDLTNVEHGHKITRGAYHEDKGPKAPKPTPIEEHLAAAPVIRDPFHSSPQEAPLAKAWEVVEAEPLALPTRAFLVWRCVAQGDDRDIMFWLWTYGRKPIIDLLREAGKEFTRLGLVSDPQSYHIFIRGWSAEDEAKHPSPFNALRAELGEVK